MQVAAVAGHAPCMCLRARMQDRAAWARWRRPTGMAACASQRPQGAAPQNLNQPHTDATVLSPSSGSWGPKNPAPPPRRPLFHQHDGQSPARSLQPSTSTPSSAYTNSGSADRSVKQQQPRSQDGLTKVHSSYELPPVAAQLLQGEHNVQMLLDGLRGLTMFDHASVLAACAKKRVAPSFELATAWGQAIMPLLHQQHHQFSHQSQSASVRNQHWGPSKNILDIKPHAAEAAGGASPPLSAAPLVAAAAATAATSEDTGQTVYEAECAQERDALVLILVSLGQLHVHFGPKPMALLLDRLRKHLSSLTPQQLIDVLRSLAALEFYPLSPSQHSGASEDVIRQAKPSSGSSDSSGNTKSTSWYGDALLSAVQQLPCMSDAQVAALLRPIALLSTSPWASVGEAVKEEKMLVKRVIALEKERDTRLSANLIPAAPPPTASASAGMFHASQSHHSLTQGTLDWAPGQIMPMDGQTQWLMCWRVQDTRAALWALAHLRPAVRRGWLNMLLNSAACHASRLTPVALSYCFQIIHSYEFVPSPPVQEVLWGWVRERWPQFSVHRAAQLAWSVTTANVPMPQAFMMSAVSAATQAVSAQVLWLQNLQPRAATPHWHASNRQQPLSEVSGPASHRVPVDSHAHARVTTQATPKDAVRLLWSAGQLGLQLPEHHVLPLAVLLAQGMGTWNPSVMVQGLWGLAMCCPPHLLQHRAVNAAGCGPVHLGSPLESAKQRTVAILMQAIAGALPRWCAKLRPGEAVRLAWALVELRLLPHDSHGQQAGTQSATDTSQWGRPAVKHPGAKEKGAKEKDQAPMMSRHPVVMLSSASLGPLIRVACANPASISPEEAAMLLIVGASVPLGSSQGAPVYAHPAHPDSEADEALAGLDAAEFQPDPRHAFEQCVPSVLRILTSSHPSSLTVSKASLLSDCLWALARLHLGPGPGAESQASDAAASGSSLHGDSSISDGEGSQGLQDRTAAMAARLLPWIASSEDEVVRLAGQLAPCSLVRLLQAAVYLPLQLPAPLLQASVDALTASCASLVNSQTFPETTAAAACYSDNSCWDQAGGTAGGKPAGSVPQLANPPAALIEDTTPGAVFKAHRLSAASSSSSYCPLPGLSSGSELSAKQLVDLIWIRARLRVTITAPRAACISAAIDSRSDKLAASAVARCLLGLSELATDLAGPGTPVQDASQPIEDAQDQAQLLSAALPVIPRNLLLRLAACTPAASAQTHASNGQLGQTSQILEWEWARVMEMTPDQLSMLLLGMAHAHVLYHRAGLQPLLSQAWLEGMTSLLVLKLRGLLSKFGLARTLSAFLILQHWPGKQAFQALLKRAKILRREGMLHGEDSENLRRLSIWLGELGGQTHTIDPSVAVAVDASTFCSIQDADDSSGGSSSSSSADSSSGCQGSCNAAAGVGDDERSSWAVKLMRNLFLIKFRTCIRQIAARILSGRDLASGSNLVAIQVDIRMSGIGHQQEDGAGYTYAYGDVGQVRAAMSLVMLQTLRARLCQALVRLTSAAPPGMLCCS